MDPKKVRTITQAKDGGIFNSLTTTIKLIVRLMADRRVNPLLKLLPVATLVYMVVPDIMIGPLDDAAVIGLGTYLFIELCPPDVVKEHRDAINGIYGGEIPDPLSEKDADIVDAEFWEEENKS
jgi:uncharacterized membrane protein YkvA (DUF1232 family)